MSISDKTRKALEGIGLAGLEIKAIAVLLKFGVQNASNLSQRSGIPHSKIYEVLGALEEKGWIDSDESRPTVYSAKSPATGLENTKQRIDDKFVQNQGTILSELMPIYEGSGTSEKPDIWVLYGTYNIASKILEMVDSCRKEIMIAMPKAGEELVRQALPKLRALYDRKIDITILTSDKMDPKAIESIKRVATVKVKEGLFGGGIISDRKHVVILLGPDVVETSKSEAIAIWADHTGLAGFAHQYFEYLLKDSKIV